MIFCPSALATKTATGKIQRYVLRNQLAASTESAE